MSARIKTGFFVRGIRCLSCLKRVSEKRNENKTKNAQGAVLMAVASRVWKLVKSNMLREYDVDLLALFL